MKIGLTGGTGFIGQHFIKEYADGNTFMVATAHETGGSYFQHKNVFYRHVGYTADSFGSAFEGCDCIVHLGAAKSSVSDERSIVNFYGNITSSENVFYAAQRLGIKNVVNISSRCVYEPGLKKPFRETAAAPLNRYGAAKLCVENIAAMFNRAYDMKIKSLRIAQVIGLEVRAGDLPAVYLEKCLQQQQLAVYGHGISAKEYIYIKDVTAAIMKACLKPELSGPFNIGSGVSTTNLELAKSFCKVFENPEGYRLLTDKKEDGLSFLMDVTLAAEQLGFCTRYSLESALADMKKEFEEQDK